MRCPCGSRLIHFCVQYLVVQADHRIFTLSTYICLANSFVLPIETTRCLWLDLNGKIYSVLVVLGQDLTLMAESIVL